MVTHIFSRLRLTPGAIGAGGAANVRIFPSPGLSGGSVNSWIICFLCHWSLLGGAFWVREFFSYFFSRDRFTQTAEIFATLKKVSPLGLTLGGGPSHCNARGKCGALARSRAWMSGCTAVIPPLSTRARLRFVNYEPHHRVRQLHDTG